jgi:hypothetical protein
MTKVTDLTKSHYEPDKIESALEVLAATGSPTRASRQVGIPEATLRHWRDNLYADRYEEICQEIAPRLKQRAIDASIQFINQAADKEAELLDSITVQDLEPKDRPGALRNVATAAALRNDKILGPLTNRPTIVVAHRTLDEYITDLSKRYPDAITVVDAEELPSSP